MHCYLIIDSCLCINSGSHNILTNNGRRRALSHVRKPCPADNYLRNQCLWMAHFPIPISRGVRHIWADFSLLVMHASNGTHHVSWPYFNMCILWHATRDGDDANLFLKPQYKDHWLSASMYGMRLHGGHRIQNYIKNTYK